MVILGTVESIGIMKLEIIRSAPEKTLRYLERYVNDGSPSGFSRPGQMGIETDPFGISPWYHPCVLLPTSGKLEVFGNVPELPGFANDTFLVHPDVSHHPDLAGLRVAKLKSMRLVPTSSGRTGRIIDPTCDYYLKFHYPFVIGRIIRALPRMKTIAGPEMSQLLQKAISTGSLTPWLHILAETGALVLHLEGNRTHPTWGLIFRQARPFGPRAAEIQSIIPLFSLWSIDRLRSFDATIIDQLFELHGRKVLDIILQRVLFPLLDAYFGLVTRAGLQIELNAQNTLLGFDENFFPVAVIFRDLNGIEKDLPLHDLLGLNTKYQSSPYKELSKEVNPDEYVIRHSFAFDSKLTNYVLLPIASAVAKAVGERDGFLLEEMRTHVRGWLSRLPGDYFPNGDIWYAHEDIDLSQSRPYVIKNSPPLR
jgi:hypothetical protein